MIVLDTDHMSLLERGESPTASRLQARLATLPPELRTTTIVSFEEQMRGWMAYLAKSRTVARQVDAYKRLQRQLDTYTNMKLLGFDERAATEFQRLMKTRIRIGTLDLRIAAIALAQDATLLTRNTSDFAKVPGLKFEDWTT
jgi:tRNA(fMet)-specific endonuclease VapC